jgi:hypothetical protein
MTTAARRKSLQSAQQRLFDTKPTLAYVEGRLEFLRLYKAVNSNLKAKDEVYLSQGGKCIYCSEPMWLEHTGVQGRYIATEDHFYPKSKGGTEKVCSCMGCNTAKGSAHPLEWVLKNARHLAFAEAPA